MLKSTPQNRRGSGVDAPHERTMGTRSLRQSRWPSRWRCRGQRTRPKPHGRGDRALGQRNEQRGYLKRAHRCGECASAGSGVPSRISANGRIDRGWGKPTQPLAGAPDEPPIGIEMSIEEKRAEARRAIEEAFAEPVRDEPIAELEPMPPPNAEATERHAIAERPEPPAPPVSPPPPPGRQRRPRGPSGWMGA
jgi:hypothetical protein